ncbi:MAG TPA: AAA family ATPase [Gaiellales bacterium]|nr:AAA family ATPase [Gaiellales bacterium]
MLIGRHAEQEELGALIKAVRASRSGVLVLRGEPGVGKSALLAELAEQAEGMLVIRATGVEAESELPFAGVHQLVWPLMERLDEIPPRQAAALRGAIGLDAPAGDDRFLIGAAVLSLLAAAAESSPVLALVDDAHLLDPESADALAFAARRLHAEPVALVFTVRDDAAAFAGAGLPELRIGGLDETAAPDLLAERSGSLSPEVRRQLVAIAGGNPLALLELPTGLSEDQLAGRSPLGDALPVTRTIEAAFLDRMRGVSQEGRSLMLLAAADDTAEPAVIVRAAAALGADTSALDEIEGTGLVEFGEREVRFRHPLVRSVVYQGATLTERQRAHLALCDALDDPEHADRRVWHRAAATLGADDELADELERSADAAMRRGGHMGASAALARAAEFTSDAEARARRLAAAATAAWLGGRPEAAIASLEPARRLVSDPLTRADIEHLRAQIELQRGTPARAHEILMAAAEEILPADAGRAGAMLVQAGEAANFAGDLQGEIAAGRLAQRLRAETGDRSLEVTMMAGVADLLEGRAADGAALLTEAIAQASASDNPRRFSWAGSCAFYLGDIGAATAYWGRFVDEARGQGAIALLAVALAYRASGEASEGRFASAVVTASEGLRLAEETGQANAAAFHRAVLARGAARCGREEECRTQAAAVFAVARERGLGIHAGHALLALGELELAAGRPAESLIHFETLWHAGPGAGSVSAKLFGMPDLVEAAYRAERIETAREALAFYEDWVTSTRSRFELPLLERCRGLLEPGAAAVERFDEALRLQSDAERPFERARTELVYGEALRRRREPKRARDHLRVALELFEQLGAAGWCERARSELRASGETARKRDPSTIDQLTPQELQIARAVATGSSNKQVAAQLFLSPRTIEFHLRHVFAKLGITSRSQLAGFDLEGLVADRSGVVTVPA